MSLRPFHLAFPVDDLEAARRWFYGQVLGCAEGRSAETWIDFNLHGHQIVAHLAPRRTPAAEASNAVEGDDVPVPHFGVVLEMADWQALAERLKAAGVGFSRRRTAHPLSGSTGRAVDDVLPRPRRQRAGVQGLPRPRAAVCDLSSR